MAVRPRHLAFDWDYLAKHVVADAVSALTRNFAIDAGRPGEVLLDGNYATQIVQHVAGMTDAQRNHYFQQLAYHRHENQNAAGVFEEPDEFYPEEFSRLLNAAWLARVERWGLAA